MTRKVFRELVDQQTAKSIFYAHLNLTPNQTEIVPLHDALGRVNSMDIYSPTDVPPFNRASMDGFAVIAKDTIDAEEAHPISLEVVGEITAGYVYDGRIQSGQCVEISTGAPMPDGADAVVMVEYTNRQKDQTKISRAVTPSENTMAAGTDIQSGERIVPVNRVLTSRELGVIAATGIHQVEVLKKPKIALFSSGDEIIPPGSELKPGKIYDINSTSILTSLLENGADPDFRGIIKDIREDIATQLHRAMTDSDLVIISGGTSAGMGDMLYEVIDELGDPGLLVHGVKVKPGKPTILAVCDGTPIIGLPGYPASALSILQLFVIPLVRQFAGLSPQPTGSIVKAITNQRIRSAEGRYEFKPMYLLQGSDGWIAFPVPGGSGAITSIALADGFVQIPENTHFIAAGSEIDIHLISDEIKLPAIQFIGDHDIALSLLQKEFEQTYPQYSIRVVGEGSRGGLEPLRRGEAHMVGVHLLDPKRGYNSWIVEELDATLIPGFYRMLGFVVPKGNPKEIYVLKDLLREDVTFLNHTSGSGIRVLLDILLDKMGVDTSEINGYETSVRSQSSAVQAVQKGTVDVTIATKAGAENAFLDFVELREEEYDILVSNKFMELDQVKHFISLIRSDQFRELLLDLPGYRPKNK